MKKLITILFVLFLSYAVSTFVVGERIKTEFQHAIKQMNSEQMVTELIAYKKSFFTSTVQVKIMIPIEGQGALQFLIDSDINHYPYKAVVNHHIILLDPEMANTVASFFQTKEWFHSHQEIDLLGRVSGKIELALGSFTYLHESLNSKPLTFDYQYDLNEQAGDFNLEWGGFYGDLENLLVDAKALKVDAHFSLLKGTHLIDYQYTSQLELFALTLADNDLMFKGVWLQGQSTVGEDRLTVDGVNHLKIESYHSGNHEFTDNNIRLSLSGLNLAALTVIKSDNGDPQVIDQALSELLRYGANINLQTLRSTTPWGEIDGQLKMDILPGSMLTEVIENPFVLIDYINGELNLSLPQKLSHQVDVGDFLQIGLMNGVFKQEDDQLTLQSSLDRGELTVNGEIIPW